MCVSTLLANISWATGSGYMASRIATMSARSETSRFSSGKPSTHATAAASPHLRASRSGVQGKQDRHHVGAVRDLPLLLGQAVYARDGVGQRLSDDEAVAACDVRGFVRSFVPCPVSGAG